MRKVMLDDQCINDVSLWGKKQLAVKNFFYCVEQYTNSDKFTATTKFNIS